MAKHFSQHPKRMARGGIRGSCDPLAMLASREWEKLKPADNSAASADDGTSGRPHKRDEGGKLRSARRSVGGRERTKRLPQPNDYSAPRRRRIRT